MGLDFLLTDLGCATAEECYTDGGIDVDIALRIMSKVTGTTLPYLNGTKYYGFVDQCGGHSSDPKTADNGANYHFHLDPYCLYNKDGTATGHSTKIGEASDSANTPIYGRYEDTDVLPELDACSAHFGFIPESPTVEVYHHHTQGKPPYSIGCYGPNDDGTMVTVEQCRSFYTGCDGVLVSYETTKGTEQYDLWCPCYDAEGSNTGVDIAPLAFQSSLSASLTEDSTSSQTQGVMNVMFT